MNNNPAKKPFADQLKEMLIELTITCLLDQPDDIVNYSTDYLKKLKEIKSPVFLYDLQDMEEKLPSDEEQSNVTREDSSNDTIDDLYNSSTFTISTRRRAVRAEPENHEKFGPKVVYPKTQEERRNLVKCISDIILFRHLDSEQMNDVLNAMFETQIQPGDVIIKEGDIGDYFYVIGSGIYEVYINDENLQMHLVHTYEGKGNFGELALLHNLPRAATVQAITKGSLWVMDRQTFRRIMFQPKKNDEELSG